MNHVHGPSCGCKEYISGEEGEDLFGCIELDKVVCLNELQGGTGPKVFKSLDKKLDEAHFVESDLDPELLFIIPFTQHVKLKSINIRAVDDDTAPVTAKLYVNHEVVDFSIAEQEPIQELKLTANLGADIENALKITKFQSVYKLILHLSAEEKDKIGVTYIGLKGIKTNFKKDQVVIATYESKPNVADHKTPNENKGFQSIQ